MLIRECQAFHFRIPYILILLGVSMLAAACGHSTESFVAKGEEYLKKRQFHQALMQFRSAVESDKDSAKAHWGMARAYENLGQFNETVDELRTTVELDKSNLDARAKLGNYFLLVQPPMIAEAEALRSQILAADSSFVEGHILTASIMSAQGRPDADIVDAVNKAIALDPQRIESYISLERLHITRDRTAEAEAAILKGLAAAPPSVTGHVEYGRFLMYASRDEEAEVQFHKAIAIDAESIEAREAIAEFFTTSRQLDKAERAYLDLVQIQENSPESRLVLAEFYGKSDRNDDAIEVLGTILADIPEYVLARYRLGQIYLEHREYAKVNEQVDALLRMNDDDAEALLLRSRLRMHESRSEEAVKDLQEVLKKQPSAREPLFLMAQARLALGQVDTANAFISDLERYHPSYLKTGLLKIQAAFTAGEPRAALKLANELIVKASVATPNADAGAQVLYDLRARGLSSRGLANLDLGRIDEAKADLEEIVRLSPRSSSALVNLAKVSLAEGSYAAALDLYEKALAVDWHNFDAVSGIASVSIKLGRTAEAHAKMDALIASHAGNNEMTAALRYLKSTLYSAERNPQAESELRAAIELDPNYLPAYSAYATLLAGQERLDEAIEQYNKVLEKQPTSQVYTLLGILEDSRGNIGAAERAYRRALEISPETSIAANNLAWLIADNQGNLDEALLLANVAVGKNQEIAGFYDTLGWVYFRKGLASPAAEQFKKAVALEEVNARRTRQAPDPGYRARLNMALARQG